MIKRNPGITASNILLRDSFLSLAEYRRRMLQAHPDHNHSPTAHEEAVALTAARNRASVLYAVFPGFRVKARGIWWGVIASHGRDRFTLERSDRQGRPVRMTVARREIVDVRCGPENGFVMLPAPRRGWSWEIRRIQAR